MRVVEKCSCGAKIDIQNSDTNAVQYGLRKFRESHDSCREKSALLQFTSEQIEDSNNWPLRFQIRRTSLQWYDDKIPYPSATPSSTEEKSHSIYWVIEFDSAKDIFQFILDVGEVVIEMERPHSPLPLIEIYDDYRE